MKNLKPSNRAALRLFASFCIEMTGAASGHSASDTLGTAVRDNH